MYHPDSMLRIAHDREAELSRDAQNCEVGKAGATGAKFAAKFAVIVLAVTILAMGLTLLVG